MLSIFHVKISMVRIRKFRIYRYESTGVSESKVITDLEIFSDILKLVAIHVDH